MGGIFLPIDAKQNTKVLYRNSEFSGRAAYYTTASVTSVTVGLIQLMGHPLPSSAPGECLQSCALIQSQSSQIERELFVGQVCVSDFVLLLGHQKSPGGSQATQCVLAFVYEKLCILVKILVLADEKRSGPEKK